MPDNGRERLKVALDLNQPYKRVFLDIQNIISVPIRHTPNPNVRVRCMHITNEKPLQLTFVQDLMNLAIDDLLALHYYYHSHGRIIYLVIQVIVLDKYSVVVNYDYLIHYQLFHIRMLK
jgi:hypothetical protein